LQATQTIGGGVVAAGGDGGAQGAGTSRTKSMRSALYLLLWNYFLKSSKASLQNLLLVAA
jgi:hypothetical protein